MESMKQLLSGSLPDYFSLNEEQIMLYEGLIMSSTISTAIAHYSNQLKSSDYNVFINKIKASNGQENTFGIRIDFKNNLDRDIVIKKILFSLDNLIFNRSLFCCLIKSISPPLWKCETNV